MSACDWQIRAYNAIASTQDEAIAAAIVGAPDRCAYLAMRQTAGRGRQNRAWQSPEGNLYFSALIRPGPIAPDPARWSLMAGLALHDAVSAFLPGMRPALKWPNDLLLGGAKLAGVLIDSALTADGKLDWVVIGAGINLAQAPTLPDRQTACLAEHGIRVTPKAMAERLMAAIDHWRARDLPAIRTAWLARAHPPGTPLRVQQAGQVLEGAFEGLAPNGALLLRGHPPITTGEVYQESPHAAGG